jgi:proteasome lid subunit RPN8/RPN11
MRKLILYKSAFDSMIFSTEEVFKRETYGWIAGKREGRDLYIVSEAFPFQTADRQYDSVNYGKREKRMEKLIKGLGLERVGDYHSHPKNGQLKKAKLKLSDEDKAWLEDHPQFISILTTIEGAQRAKRSQVYDDRIECFFQNGGNPRWYKLKIAGYYYDPLIKEHSTLKIVPCPKLEKLLLAQNNH